MRHFNSVNLIHLLLQINQPSTVHHSQLDRLLRLNRHAALLCAQASRESGRNISNRQRSLDKENAALNARVAAELERINLTHVQQFNRVVAAIEAWQLVPSDPAFHPCQRVRQILIDVLPKVRQKQEVQAICHEYQAHLKQEIVSELKDKHPQEYAQFTANRKIIGVPLPGSGKLPAPVILGGQNMDRFVAAHPQGIPQGSHGLNAAIRKYATVNTMCSTLTTPQPVDQQLQQFKQTFQSQRAIIEKDRDSWAMKFAKGVATVLSIGFAWAMGIWNVRGKEASEDLQTVLNQPPAPVITARVG